MTTNYWTSFDDNAPRFIVCRIRGRMVGYDYYIYDSHKDTRVSKFTDDPVELEVLAAELNELDHEARS